MLMLAFGRNAISTTNTLASGSTNYQQQASKVEQFSTKNAGNFGQISKFLKKFLILYS
jgi:hypothetical protein